MGTRYQKVRSALCRSLLVAAWLCLPLALPAQPGRLVERYEVEHYDVQSLLAAADRGQPIVLEALGADHELRLERTFLRSERFRARAFNRDGSRGIRPPTARTFKGTVEGDPESMVRLSFTARGLSGVIRTDDLWTYIEPLPRAGEHMVFSDRDLDPSFQGHCEQQLLPGSSHGNQPQPLSTAAPATTAATLVPALEIAIDVDVEYFQLYGESTSLEVEGVLNTVAGIFELELGISLELVALNIWEEEEDPYTETGALELLTQFQDYWNSSQPVGRGLAHLFTGKDLDESTVGIAYVGVVCNTAYAYGLSQDIGSSALMPLLVAHEIGHNLNAVHDPGDSTPHYIMYPSLSASTLDEFSDQSKQDIAAFLGGVSCIEVPEGGGEEGGGEEGGDDGDGDTPPPASRSSGGPVDPLVALIALGWAAARIARRRRPV